jgi:hypothetical protein
LKYTTRFIFGQDYTTGEYGCLPLKYKGSDFNYSWDPVMLFHDSCEHWFEQEHKYFSRDAAWNIGGEIAAMGHLYYIYDTFYLNSRFRPSSRSNEENIMITCGSEMEEAVKYGYCNYGNELVCHIPYQRPTNSYMETMIIEQYNKLKSCYFEVNQYTSEQEKEFAENYKKSITLGKLQRLYRWGYHSAAKRFPWSNKNSNKIHKFYSELESLIKHNLEDIMFEYEFLDITIYTGQNFNYKIKLIPFK